MAARGTGRMKLNVLDPAAHHAPLTPLTPLTLLTLLLSAAVQGVQLPDPSPTLTNERSTIERTYELTKYLEHQLREIKDTYLSYLGPPFSDPDFAPPRPNSSSLSVPSAATRVDLWQGLERGARLAQNQRAYRVLLCAVRELARSTLCPYLQTSLLHFCSGLNGLLGSITGLMGMLGEAPPHPDIAPPLAEGWSLRRPGAVQHSPAPLRAPSRQRGRDSHPGATATRKKEKERVERGRRGGGRDGDMWEAEDEEMGANGEMERWSRRRRLLSVEQEDDKQQTEAPPPALYSSSLRRSSRSLSSLQSPTIPPSFSLLLQYGGGAEEGHTLLATPLLTTHPTANDFSRKVEGFWVLRELQSWLWRSAKDFNRLKKNFRS